MFFAYGLDGERLDGENFISELRRLAASVLAEGDRFTAEEIHLNDDGLINRFGPTDDESAFVETALISPSSAHPVSSIAPPAVETALVSTYSIGTQYPFT